MSILEELINKKHQALKKIVVCYGQELYRLAFRIVKNQFAPFIHMKNNRLYMKKLLLSLMLCYATIAGAQTDRVNVFLGSSGDHGQLSPAASSPFHQLSIVPYTNPGTHTGYEHLAKEIKGFTHNRLEGVGCMGSGGLILIRPFIKNDIKPLNKIDEHAQPGYYALKTAEGIQVEVAVNNDFGREQYTFPVGIKGLFFDFGHAFNGAFVDNEFTQEGNLLFGKVRAKTTCHVGTYTIYYALEIPTASGWRKEGNKIWVDLKEESLIADVNIAFSAVDQQDARKTLAEYDKLDFSTVKKRAADRWKTALSVLQVKGDSDKVDLFYSLLYRSLQSPFVISDEQGNFRGTDGKIHRSKETRYHGWAIWDNYKTQLPLLELIDTEMYQGVVSSIADLYRYGKFDFAGAHEPANSVRTEHAAVVLLDAVKKGYRVDIDGIKDSLIYDTLRYDFKKPDKYLEACYDMWAMSKLFPQNSKTYLERAKSYQAIWNKDFKDLTKRDVDRMSARDMYQGTIRQYRWNVPFDVMGLRKLAGGEENFTQQLDEFYDGYYFNRANEPDMQSLTLYNASKTPWRYQEWIHRIALDTIIQYYFNDNSRGIGAHIDRIYKNEPKAFVRTMDDDAGAMSSWWVLSAIGLQQPLVGEPIFYISVPFFDQIRLENKGNPLTIEVPNRSDKMRYIKSIKLNGRDLKRLWITHEELRKGGTLQIESSEIPTDYGRDDPWISHMDNN
jgi:putative alpha-1,2-mannosidase